MAERISDEEYELIQSQIFTLAAVIAEMNLEGFLDRISEAESIAPILDPTLFIRGSRNLEKIKELAVSIQRVKRTVINLLGG